MKILLNPQATLAKVALLLCIAFTGLDANAQCYYNQDSTELDSFAYCSLPATVALHVHGKASYTTADSIKVRIQWSYGDSLTMLLPLTYISFNSALYDTTVYHTYNLSGVAPIEVSLSETYYTFVCVKNLATFVSNGCDSISGRSYKDSNSNCQIDLGDDLLYGQTIVLRDSNGTAMNAAITDINGNYSCQIPSSQIGLELTKTVFDYMTEVYCPDSGYFDLDTVTNLNQSFDFGEECNALDSFDIFTLTRSTKTAAPGDTGHFSFLTRGRTCDLDSVSSIVTLSFDSLLEYNGILMGPTPDSIVGRTIFWSYALSDTGQLHGYNLAGTMHRISFIMDTGATLNDSVLYITNIDPTLGDIDPTNNSWQRYMDVNSSYDPNNIIVDPQGFSDQGYVERDQRMYYTINFQNTGTAPARNVYLIDTLSSNLNLATFRLEAMSHQMETKFYDGVMARFNFFNIDLADSATNEPESKGFVTYSIEMQPGLAVGTQIKNTAHIFFDYNAAIITNTALSTIYEPAVVIDPLEISLSAEDVTCIGNDNGGLAVDITSGNPPYSINWNNGSTSSTQDEIGPGSYSVTVVDAEFQEETSSIEVTENRIHDAPEVGEISGTLAVQSWQSYTYTVATSGLSEFSWAASGGEVLSTTANSVEVLWQAGPTGTLYLVEKDGNGCYGNDSIQVPIQFVGINEPKEYSFSMYPNPTDGVLVIELNALTGTEEVQIRDVHGRLIQSKRIDSGNTYLDLRNVAKGVHTVTVLNESGTEHQRLIVR